MKPLQGSTRSGKNGKLTAKRIREYNSKESPEKAFYGLSAKDEEFA